MPRPCGVADERRGGSTGRPVLTIHWPASMPATLRADPPPACSRHRGPKVKSQSEERGSLPVGAHPVRDRRGRPCAAVAHWVRSYRGRQGFLEHPPHTPALSPGERGRSVVFPYESCRFNEAALSPLRYGALRCSRFVRGSTQLIRLVPVRRRFYPTYC